MGQMTVGGCYGAARGRSWMFGAALFVWVGVATSAWGQVLENDRVRLSFDVAHGGLIQMTDKALGRDLLAPEAATTLWTIDTGDTACPSITPAMAKTLTFDTTGLAGTAMELEWSQFNLPNAPELHVVATVRVKPGDPIGVWRIRVVGLGQIPIKSIHYPCVGPIAKQEREALAVPLWIGERSTRARELVHDAKGAPKRLEWQYPGILSMQWMTLYSEGGTGLYAATDDSSVLSKRFVVAGSENGGIGFEIVHQPELRSDLNAYALPYDVLLGGFRGDWYTAAAMYRAWADDQAWVANSRVKRTLVPGWVVNTALWEWNRGPSPGVLGPAVELQRALGAPVSVFWHWWHGCAYDIGFPEYFPPREGEGPFREAVAAAHQQGIHEIVYMNQRLWGMTTKSWKDEGAEKFAVKGEDGKPLAEVYNVFTKAPCAPMCIGTPFWRDKYAGLATRAVHELGVDGVYMDQACSSLACYDASHGHPIGGGRYWIDGFKDLTADIRIRTGHDVPALAGEGCGEAWLPYLDMMLSLQVSMERYAAPGDWEPVPLFQAVYHDAAIQFGNYSSLAMPPYDALWPAQFAPAKPLALLDQKFSTQFRLEQARAFVWGQQPALANFMPEQLTERPKEIAYAMKLAKLRLLWKKYLLEGVFLSPPEIGAPAREIPISRLSIYAGQQEHLREYTKACPMALASAWRARDGAVGIVIASISDTPEKLTLDLQRLTNDIPKEALVYELDEAGRKEIAKAADWLAPRPIEIAAEGVRCFEFVGAK